MSIFISYHGEEMLKFARLLKDKLEDDGYDIFLDEENIESGDDLHPKIKEGIEAADLLLFLIEEDATIKRLKENDSRNWLRMELEFALKRKHSGELEVIPVLHNTSNMPKNDDWPCSVKDISDIAARRVYDDKGDTLDRLREDIHNKCTYPILKKKLLETWDKYKGNPDIENNIINAELKGDFAETSNRQGKWDKITYKELPLLIKPEDNVDPSPKFFLGFSDIQESIVRVKICLENGDALFLPAEIDNLCDLSSFETYLKKDLGLRISILQRSTNFIYLMINAEKISDQEELSKALGRIKHFNINFFPLVFLNDINVSDVDGGSQGRNLFYPCQPDKPFKGLQHYTEEDHQLYFDGRLFCKNIVELCKSDDKKKSSPDLILVTGPSGTGKSSALHAGVLPKLKTDRNRVVFIKLDDVKDPFKFIYKKLVDAKKNPNQPEKDLIEWWYKSRDKNISYVIILDQIEDFFVNHRHERIWHAERNKSFIKTIAQLVRNKQRDDHIILCVRSEIRDAVENSFTDEFEVHTETLNPISTEEVRKVLNDIKNSNLIKRRYNISFDESVDGKSFIDSVCEHLSGDIYSPVAPTLQLILLRMWDNLRGNKKRFSGHIFTQSIKSDMLFPVLISEIIRDVAKKYQKHQKSSINHIEGFLLDFLDFHTDISPESQYLTTRSVERETLSKRYINNPYDSIEISDVTSLLEKHYLLIKSPHSPSATRLTHESMAYTIRDLHQKSFSEPNIASLSIKKGIYEWEESRNFLHLRDASLLEKVKKWIPTWGKLESLLVNYSHLFSEKPEIRKDFFRRISGNLESSGGSEEGIMRFDKILLWLDKLDKDERKESPDEKLMFMYLLADMRTVEFYSIFSSRKSELGAKEINLLEKCGKENGIRLIKQKSLSRKQISEIECNGFEYIEDFVSPNGKIPLFKHVGIKEISTGTEMVFAYISEGTFTMGSKEKKEESPPHSVVMSPMLISQYTVTQKVWESTMGEMPEHFEQLKNECRGDNYPIVFFLWEECIEFCRKVGLSLPTEAEWEYAAKGGHDVKWPCGHFPRWLDDYAWYEANSGNQIREVGRKLPNAFGLYDICGNVWEYCSDYPRRYNDSEMRDPVGPDSPIDSEPEGEWKLKWDARLMRGGCFNSPAPFCRLTFRNYIETNKKPRDVLGFRLVYRLLRDSKKIVKLTE